MLLEGQLCTLAPNPSGKTVCLGGGLVSALPTLRAGSQAQPLAFDCIGMCYMAVLVLSEPQELHNRKLI